MHISSSSRSGGPVARLLACRPARLLLAGITAAAACAALGGSSAGAITIPQGAPAPTVALGTVATNGTVYAVAVKGNTAYVGGDFSVVGTPSGSVVSLDPTTAAQAGTWPAVNGSVLASVADGAGGSYIAGDFTVVGGLRRYGLAHITSAGAVDTGFVVPVDGTVLALYLSGSTLYLGGSFSGVNGTARDNAAAVNATTGALLGFAPQPNSEVAAITGNGTDIYLGGSFTTLTGPATRNRLAAVDPTTGVPTAWNPNLNNSVQALALSGTTIYAGGFFTSVNQGATPVTRNRVAAFSTTTGTATSWNPDVGGTVYALLLSGSTVYAGGAFTGVNGGTTRIGLAAFDSSGVITSFDPNVSGGYVRALGLSGTTLYATGRFTSVNGSTARRNAAAFDTTVATGNAVSWNPAPGGEGRTIALGGGRVLLGGYFNLLGGSVRNNVAAIDVTTGALTSFNPDADGVVHALAVGASTLYLGGEFVTVNGTTARNYVAEVSLASGTATSFDPNLGNTVYALDLEGSTLYAGGNFTTVNGGTTRNRLAAFSTSTGTATTFDPNVSSAVWAITVRGTTLYAGGQFSTVNGGTTRNRVAAFDTGTSAVTAFDPNVDSTVYALALNADGSTLYAGGFFSTVNGSTPRSYAAAFSTVLSTGNVLAFNPNPDDGVRTIAVDGAGVYLGGSMQATLSPNVSHVNALRVNPTTGAPDAWDPLVHAPEAATVYGIVPLANGNVLLVGDIDSAGTAVVGGIAIIGPSQTAAAPSPPVSSAVALPNTPVTVATSKTGDASKPTVSLTAPAGAFNNQIGVTVGMTLVTSTLPTPGGFKAVGTTVSVVVTGATPDRITTFTKPIEIIYHSPESDSAPQYSADGITWVAIPQLPAGTTTLPAGQRDGWYKDAAGAIHVLTLHATYFALLQGGPSSAAAPAAKSTALSLITFGVKSKVKRVAGGVTVFFLPSKAIDATAVLSLKGKAVATAKAAVAERGAGKLRLVFPKGMAKGAYRVTLTALAGSEKALKSVPLTVS